MNQSYKALAAAVVIQAARDARAGDTSALYWLKTDGLVWCEGLGIDLQPDQIEHFMHAKKTRIQIGRPHKYHKKHGPRSLVMA